MLLNTPRGQWVGLACLAALLTACHPNASKPVSTSRVYTVNGLVKELEPDGETVIVRHDAIPGYMPSMTMPFEVRDTNLLHGLKAGDGISFKLAVTPAGEWIEAVTKLPPVRIFQAKGVIKALDVDGKTVTIRHDAIPGYMPSMIMPFDVKDAKLLRGLKAGDGVSFQLAVTPTDGWVESITKLYSAAPQAAVKAAPQPVVMDISRALEPLDIGDRLPDYQFTNELGQPVRLSQFKGQVLAFTFFFTSCPFPNYCVRMTSNFGQAERELESMTNAPAHWRLLSISFDPAHDTPSKLAAYAEAAHYDKSHWTFLTGAKDQIGGLADQIGENFWHEGNSIGHNLRTVLVDPTGHIRDIIPGNKWKVADFVKEFVRAERR